MILKRTSLALAVAALILGTAVALKYAEGLEIVTADSSRRTMQVMIGLILAAYANVMPKDIGQWRASTRGATTSQSVLRFGGWLMTLAGLAYAGLWAFAPIPVADVAATVVVATATLLMATYATWAAFSCRRTGRGAADSNY